MVNEGALGMVLTYKFNPEHISETSIMYKVNHHIFQNQMSPMINQKQ